MSYVYVWVNSRDLRKVEIGESRERDLREVDQKTRIKMPSKILLIFYFSISILAAISSKFGVVNSDFSVPFATMNQKASALLIGDLKTLLFWKDLIAPLIMKSVKETDRFSGGVADESERVQNNTYTAIACSSKETWVYKPLTSREFPNGQWDELSGIDDSFGPRLCAISSMGSFAILSLQKKYLIVDGSKISLEKISSTSQSERIELISSGSGFLVLSSSGLAQKIELSASSSSWISLPPVKHPYTSGKWSDTTRFAATETLLIKSDSFRTELLSIALQNASISAPTRLPITPCNDEETCIPFISTVDNSWSISGTWGHYIGQGLNFTRLKSLPNAASGSAGIAFVHQKLGGKFFYLGNTDSDFGLLSRVDSHTLVKPKPFNLPYFTPLLEKGSDSNPWWPEYLGIQKAWDLAESSNIVASLVRIGYVDSGALVSHPDIAGQLFQSPLEVPRNGQDDDDNKFLDDRIGYDFVNENSTIVDQLGHGTHVAGLLVGQNSQLGLTASAKNGRLTVIRALDRGGKSTSIDLSRALQYAIDQDVEVLNLSWGGGGITQALRDIFEKIHDSGIVVFSSAGNDGSSNDPPNVPEVPKNFPGVIGVGAITKQSTVASYSNYGSKSVQFLAPGDSILSATKDGQHGVLSGTSMASPVAASAYSWILGIVKAKCITAGCTKSKLELRKQALDILCQSSTPNPKAICGIINVFKATQLVLDTV